jgi:hypothetical protein
MSCLHEEVITKKPHLSFKNWGLKTPFHTFLPSKVIGEHISEGMIVEWEGMSTSKKGSKKGKLLRG